MAGMSVMRRRPIRTSPLEAAAQQAGTWRLQ